MIADIQPADVQINNSLSCADTVTMSLWRFTLNSHAMRLSAAAHRRQCRWRSSRWLRVSRHKISKIITSTSNKINYVVQGDRDAYTLPSAGNYTGSKQVHNCKFDKSIKYMNLFLLRTEFWPEHLGLHLLINAVKYSKSAQRNNGLLYLNESV